MSEEFFSTIQKLIGSGQWEVSEHAFTELANDGILIEPLILDVVDSKIVEYYPDFHKGPCVLVLQIDENSEPIHLLWGVPQNKAQPAVLITAYRPDPDRWTNDFLSRREK